MKSNRNSAVDANTEGRIALIKRLEANRNRALTMDLEDCAARNQRNMMAGTVETRSLWSSGDPVPVTVTPLAPD
jgi:hypothetical protein